jgi:hypothetical protein
MIYSGRNVICYVTRRSLQEFNFALQPILEQLKKYEKRFMISHARLFEAVGFFNKLVGF